MGAVPLGWGIAGVLLLVFTWVCWTGRWRAWAESPLAGTRPLFVPFTLGFGIFGLSYPFWGMLPSGPGDAVFGVGFFALFSGFILMFWSPRWLGPRWFRELRRAFSDEAWNSRSWMAEDWRRPGESSVDATYRHRSSGRPPPPAAVFVRLYADPHGLLGGRAWWGGALLYYPQAPVTAVAASVEEERQQLREEIIPAEAMVGASRLAPGTDLDGSRSRSGLRSWVVPRVRVDTNEGPWLFEIPRAKRAVEELRRRYIDRSDGPEPSWMLGERQPAEANRLKESR